MKNNNELGFIDFKDFDPKLEAQETIKMNQENQLMTEYRDALRELRIAFPNTNIDSDIKKDEKNMTLNHAKKFLHLSNFTHKGMAHGLELIKNGNYKEFIEYSAAMLILQKNGELDVSPEEDTALNLNGITGGEEAREGAEGFLDEVGI